MSACRLAARALLALALLGAAAVAALAQRPRPESPGGPVQPAGAQAEALADSLASVVLAAPGTPTARLAAFERARAALTHRPLVRVAADTLGVRLLLGVQVVPSPGVALRCVQGHAVRPVNGDAVGAGPAGIHALERVLLARVRPLYGQPGALVALAWFAEPGPAPYVMWLASVDSLPGVPRGLRRTAMQATSGESQGGLRVLSRDGETLLATVEPNWAGAAAFDARLCRDCPHLHAETVWRLDGAEATRLRVEPVDDAAWAVARAFDARQGFRAWPAADVSVAPGVDRWMRDRRWAVLHEVTPLGGDDAHVRISSNGPGDSLGVVVRRVPGGWKVAPAR